MYYCIHLPQNYNISSDLFNPLKDQEQGPLIIQQCREPEEAYETNITTYRCSKWVYTLNISLQEIVLISYNIEVLNTVNYSNFYVDFMIFKH